MHRDEHGEVPVPRGAHGTPGEGRDDTGVDVHDIDRIGIEDPPDLSTGTGMHRQLEGQARRHPVHGDPIDEVESGSHAAMARRRSDDPHVTTTGGLSRRQRLDLRLDAPGTGRVAVADVGDPHVE